MTIQFQSVTLSCGEFRTKEQREHDEMMRQAQARRDYHSTKHFTVGELIERLSKLDPSLPVCLYDGEYNDFYEATASVTERDGEFANFIGKHVVIGWDGT